MNWIYLLSILYSFTAAHDIHICKADLHYKSDKKVMQISIHIFLDDLEAELISDGAKDPKLCTEKESEDAESFLLQYITDRFKVRSASNELNLNYIGKEPSEDLIAVWCYFEVPIESFTEIDVINTIMFEKFDDQQNMISFKVDGKRRSFHITEKGDGFQKLKV